MKALIIYSGGLDTTVCIPLVREMGYSEILTVTIDVGQPATDIHRAVEVAGVLGTRHFTIDAKREFADEYCFAAIGANADYFGYPLSTAIARPLIAKKAAEVGLQESVHAFVHGCTGKGNDQFRIEFGLRVFAPNIPVVAPIRERNLTRTWEIEYAESNQIPVGQSKENIWSIDENLWGRSIEGGMLEDPGVQPPDEIFQWTQSPMNAPEDPETLVIEFSDGKPVSLDGESLGPLELIQACNRVAGKHGVGRIDIMEDRIFGLKVRENYECPAAAVLIACHRALEALVTTHDERKFKSTVDASWAEQIYRGLWWDPLTEDLTAFISNVQRRVTGSVTVRLYRGSVQIVARQSPWALYSEAAASFDDAEVLSQSSMTGMVQSHGMSSLLYYRLKNFN